MNSKKQLEEAAYYDKQQLLSSKRYRGNRDALSALLEDRKFYTLQEVDSVLTKFLKERVI